MNVGRKFIIERGVRRKLSVYASDLTAAELQRPAVETEANVLEEAETGRLRMKRSKQRYANQEILLIICA